MEPDVQLGDLVVARKQNSYDVDQRVVYNHPQVGFVFHRIVDRDQKGFVLKGDNNDWLDSVQPTQSDIVGKYWFMIPGAGNLIRTLREPIFFVALIVFIAAIIAFLFLFPNQEHIRNKKGSNKSMSKTTNSGSAGDNRQDLLLCLGLLALAAIVLGVVAFSRSLTMSISDDVVYQHKGTYSYTASDEGGIYDRTGVETGDPIYPLLTCKVKMKYSYQMSSKQFSNNGQKDINGTFRMTATLSDADGWNRSFLLIPDYEFSGPSVEALSTLDICRMLDIIADKELKTGSEIRAYTLSILPEVTISGSISGNSFNDDFSPGIEFLLGQKVLRMPDAEEVFQVEQERFIPQTREVPNQLFVLGKPIQIRTLRWIACVGFGLSLLGAIYPAWAIYSDWKESSESRIRIQNQPLLVDIKPGSLKTKGLTVIEVSSFQDLRKMAERYGALIMHEGSGTTHRYALQDGSTLYSYSMESTPEVEDEK